MISLPEAGLADVTGRDCDVARRQGLPVPPWLSRAGRRPAVRHLALLAAFLAVSVAMTWPRATYLAQGLVPASRDSASYVWDLWWMARQVAHLGNPWFTRHMAAPAGVQIGYHTLMPLPGVLLAPATWALGAAFSYNLLVVVVPGLLCYTMYRAARLWLRSAVAAAATGAFYGYSAMLTQQAWYHVNIAAGAMFLPMALEASVRLRRAPGRGQAVILGIVMGAAVLTDQESAVLAAIVAVLALAPWLARARSGDAVWLSSLTVTVGAVIASPQIIAMIQERVAGGLNVTGARLALSYKQYGVGLPGMFSPTPRVNDVGLGVLAGPFLHSRDNEGMPMFGAVLTVLAVAGIIAAWRRRGAWLLAGLWLGCSALALGASLWIGKRQYLPLASTWNGVRVSDLMPYTWFVRIPGLESFREADRLVILGLLPAVLLAGAAVDWLRDHARALLVAVLALGVLEAGYAGTQPGRPGVGTTSVSLLAKVDAPIAADHSNSVVLDLPFGLRGGIPVYGRPFLPQALLMAAEDGHPRSIAYVSRVPSPTISAIRAHPFYRDLADIVQHEMAPACPWRAPARPGRPASCATAPGTPPRNVTGLTPRQLAAARADARRLRIGWAVMWTRNPTADTYVRSYLLGAGFALRYRVGGVLVYRHAVGRRAVQTGKRSTWTSAASASRRRSPGSEVRLSSPSLARHTPTASIASD